MDQDAINLAKAIRQRESGGNFNAVGDNGTSKGGYQFQSGTWKQYSKEILGQDNAEMTPANQNAVAYGKIKQWKDQGKNPAQIAAMWNAGEGIGDKWVNHRGKTTIGGKVLSYDTPQYVKDVTDLYQKNKNQLTNQSQNSQQIIQPPADLLQKAGKVANVASLGIGKTTGEAIGTLGGLAYEKAKGLLGGQDNSKFYDTSAPTPLQVAGDVAQGALTVGTGLGGKSVGILGKTVPTIKTAGTVLGRITQAANIGAGLGLAGGLKEGKTKATDLLKSTAVGLGSGLLAGGTGEGISKLATWLPKRMLPFNISDKTANYALTKNLGNPTKMLSTSDNEIQTMGNKIGSMLNKQEYANIRIPGRDIYARIAQDLPDAKLSPDELIKEVTKVAKLKKGLVEKLFTPQGLSLPEIQRLKSEIGNNVYKSVFDNPETKAGKQIGNAVYHALGDAIKSIAPETEPIYDQMTKEYLLNNAIRKFVNKSGGKAAITLNDLVAFEVGGLPAAIGRRVIGSPTLNLKTAGMINKVGNSGVGKIAKPAIVQGLGKLFGGNVNVKQ